MQPAVAGFTTTRLPDQTVLNALSCAYGACDNLIGDTEFHPQMRAFLRLVAPELLAGSEPEPDTIWPLLPPRRRYLNSLEPASALRPAREKAYEALDELLAAGWPLTSKAAKQQSDNLVSVPRF